MKNYFDKEITSEIINRINLLNNNSQPLWGKMSVSQMLAHCNVTYELVYENKNPKPNFFKKILLKLFVKNFVVNEKPYKQNGPTGKEFIIKIEKDFDSEKKRLISYLLKTQKLGGSYFHNKESHSFGALTTSEWNNLFYKHLDHHLSQFGV